MTDAGRPKLVDERRSWQAALRDGFVVGAAIAALLFLWAGVARAADQTPLKDLNSHPATFGATDTVGAPHGGTGLVSPTAHCVIIGEGASPAHVVCPVLATDVLTDNGPGNDPSFQAAAGGVPCTSTALSVQYDNAGAFGCVSGVTSNGAALTFAANDLILGGATSGTLKLNCAAVCGSGVITLPNGTTDLSATGGAHQFLKQSSAGAALTVGQPACTDLSDATYCNVSLTNGITLGNIAQASSNTVLGNPTGSTANVQAESVTDCHGSSQAVIYTAGTGWGCHSPGGGSGNGYEKNAPTPPSGLTQFNNHVTTLTVGTFSSLLTLHGTNSGFESYELTAPATPYDLVCRIQIGADSTGYSAGLIVRNSSSGKAITLAQYAPAAGAGGQLIQNWNSATSIFSTNATTWQPPVPQWLRIKNDGTNLNFYISYNGSEWFQISTGTLASFISSVDKVGIFGYPITTGTNQVAYFSWFGTTLP